MDIDPVCGMYIDEKSAAATYEYGGKTYYFCIQICKAASMKDPDRYIQTEINLADARKLAVITDNKNHSKINISQN